MEAVSTRRAAIFIAVLVGTVALVCSAHAQTSGNGFLFERPSGAAVFRIGFDHANAGGDLFAFVTDELTLGRRDFSSPTFVAEFSYRVAPRLETVLGFGVSRTSNASEFRHWVDNNDQPIQQQTTFMRVPIAASLKGYLRDTGRAIGRFAWIPARYAPYVGAGGGIVYYSFEQTGDFIDFSTTNVFPDTFNSSGWRPTAHAFVGTDVSLNTRLALTAEGRYEWASAAPGNDFTGFNRIDLSGFSLTAGIVIRY